VIAARGGDERAKPARTGSFRCDDPGGNTIVDRADASSREPSGLDRC
jgi:hypothetical protein